MADKTGYDYAREDIVDALRKAGLGKGDNVFTHCNVGVFGRLKGASKKDDYYRLFKQAIFDVIGDTGTWIVPTFSYSFCWNKDFDVEKTPGVCGALTEMVRLDPAAKRSEDANFSVAAVGKNAGYFTGDAPEYSFGPGSFWDKFLSKGGKICNFNINASSTFIHFVERTLRVPYRYDKPFRGTLTLNGEAREKVFYHFVCDLEKPEDSPEFTKFDRRARELGMARVIDLGKGQITSISAKDSFELIKNELEKDPFFIRKGKG